MNIMFLLAARPLKGLVSQRFFKKRTNLYERGKKAKGRDGYSFGGREGRVYLKHKNLVGYEF